MARAWITGTFGVWDLFGPLALYAVLLGWIWVRALKRQLRPRQVAWWVLPPTLLLDVYGGWLYGAAPGGILVQVLSITVTTLIGAEFLERIVPAAWGSGAGPLE